MAKRTRRLSAVLALATSPFLLTPPASGDILHLDDVIVVGRQCVGQDCQNGESFGTDRIRIKENTVRLHFDDTSTSPGFPNNDWRLLANSFENGGPNEFVIEDSTAGRSLLVLEAAAPANSIYVDASGQVGFGTSTPETELHSIDGDSPALRLEQDASGSFTPQTWDVAGNETNFFVRDVTNGSSLPFKIRPGAPTGSLDISATGDIGIGDVATSGIKLTVHGDVAFGSSRDSKRDLMPASGEEVLARVRKLPIFSWSYRDDPGQAQHLGPVAEDFHAAFGLGADERFISAVDASGVALAAIQELSRLLSESRREVADLTERLATLEALVRKQAAPVETSQRPGGQG